MVFSPSLAAGEAPFWYSADCPRSLALSLKTGKKFWPPVMVRGLSRLGVSEVVDDVAPPSAAPGAAMAGFSRKAEAGLPPNVSASEAFSAYGTLTNCTRDCSTSPGRLNWTPNQRGSVEENRSTGTPSF